jgi:hypothetical protein
MMAGQILFSDEYAGDRWMYGLTYRGLGVATVPAGWLIEPGRAVPNLGFAFGTVQYPRELTAQEVAAFELTLVASPCRSE